MIKICESGHITGPKEAPAEPVAINLPQLEAIEIEVLA